MRRNMVIIIIFSCLHYHIRHDNLIMITMSSALLASQYVKQLKQYTAIASISKHSAMLSIQGNQYSMYLISYNPQRGRRMAAFEPAYCQSQIHMLNSYSKCTRVVSMLEYSAIQTYKAMQFNITVSNTSRDVASSGCKTTRPACHLPCIC